MYCYLCYSITYGSTFKNELNQKLINTEKVKSVLTATKDRVSVFYEHSFSID